jgi:hypothetical protein
MYIKVNNLILRFFILKTLGLNFIEQLIPGILLGGAIIYIFYSSKIKNKKYKFYFLVANANNIIA